MPSNKKKKRMAKLRKNPEKINGQKLVKAAPEIEERLRGASKETIVQIKEDLVTDIAFDLDPNGNPLENRFCQCLWLAQLVAPGDGPRCFGLQQKLAPQIEKQMISLLTTTEGELSDDDCYLRLKTATLLAAQKNKTEIISVCFEGSAAAFDRHYSRYQGLSDRDFVAAMAHGVNPNLKEISTKIHTAVYDIKLGLHKTVNICWNCGKKSHFHCTKCLAARYCGEECQLAHWAQDHKEKCKEVKETYELYQESMDAIDQAFQNQDRHEECYRVRPSYLDYGICRHSLVENYRYRCHLQQLTGSKQPEGPSMHFFHQNIGHVVHDGLWLYPCPERTILPNKEAGNNKDHFGCIASALMYNYEAEDGSFYVDQFCLMVEAFAGIQGLPLPKEISPRLEPEHWLGVYLKGLSVTNSEQCFNTFRKKSDIWFFERIRYKHSGVVLKERQRQLE